METCPDPGFLMIIMMVMMMTLVMTMMTVLPIPLRRPTLALGFSIPKVLWRTPDMATTLLLL